MDISTAHLSRLFVGVDGDDSVDCNIGHPKDPSFTLFLNQSTVSNHPGKTRELSVGYNHDNTRVFGTVDL